MLPRTELETPCACDSDCISGSQIRLTPQSVPQNSALFCHPFLALPPAVFGQVHAEDGWGVRWRPLPAFRNPCDRERGQGQGLRAASASLLSHLCTLCNWACLLSV